MPGDAVSTAPEMKTTGSTSMRTIGSLSLCRSLLRAGLVDRFRVVVFPVSTGQKRIYDGYPDVASDMTDGRTFDGRVQRLENTPRILDRPPNAETHP